MTRQLLLLGNSHNRVPSTYCRCTGCESERQLDLPPPWATSFTTLLVESAHPFLSWRSSCNELDECLAANAKLVSSVSCVCTEMVRRCLNFQGPWGGTVLACASRRLHCCRNTAIIMLGAAIRRISITVFCVVAFSLSH